LYTGYTNDLEKRLETHRKGLGAKYVKARLPCEMIYHEEFATKSEAMKREYEIKHFSRERKIKALGLNL
jgi:putative endonuclease